MKRRRSSALGRNTCGIYVWIVFARTVHHPCITWSAFDLIMRNKRYYSLINFVRHTSLQSLLFYVLDFPIIHSPLHSLLFYVLDFPIVHSSLQSLLFYVLDFSIIHSSYIPHSRLLSNSAFSTLFRWMYSVLDDTLGLYEYMNIDISHLHAKHSHFLHFRESLHLQTLNNHYMEMSDNTLV